MYVGFLKTLSVPEATQTTVVWRKRLLLKLKSNMADKSRDIPTLKDIKLTIAMKIQRCPLLYKG